MATPLLRPRPEACQQEGRAEPAPVSESHVMMHRLGKYVIAEKLGEGAMGAVYKAYDEVLDRHVAIKTMGEEIRWDPELKLRFYREARSAASLHHPNIITV